MPCYKPLLAYHAPSGITFNRKKSTGQLIQLPCGRCIGCRLDKAKQWALRCHHEASMHTDNDFITLTYANENLPENNSLDKSHFSKFIRALRKKTKQKIRYYMCGEYGEAVEKNNFIARPHYHAIIFGYTFPNQKLVKIRNGNRCYISPFLTEMWTHGTHEISAVTFSSSGYVARYILKKQNGEYGLREYGIPDPETGELDAAHQRVYPYTSMSLKKGIGETWYEKFKDDLFPHDYAVMPDGRQMPVPTYYRRLLEKEDPALYSRLREIRVEKAKHNPDNTHQRLATRELIQTKKAERLIREL